MKTAARNWPHQHPDEFHEDGTHAPTHRWNVNMERGGEYLEK